jgi:hypothetical protein
LIACSRREYAIAAINSTTPYKTVGAGLRAVPFNELVDLVPIAVLSVDRGQAV